jgi:hypothetical protein
VKEDATAMEDKEVEVEVEVEEDHREEEDVNHRVVVGDKALINISLRVDNRERMRMRMIMRRIWEPTDLVITEG